MPDILDQLQAGQVAQTNANLAQAKHDSDWANWFTSTPPSEVLRQNLNLTSMIDKAVEQKQRIIAQTDENAQRIYLNNKRFQAEQELQPLKVQHAQAQIDNETQSARLALEHETRVNSDTGGFQNDIRDALAKHPRGSKEFAKATFQAALNNPYAQPSLKKQFFDMANIAEDPEMAVNQIPEEMRGRVELANTGEGWRATIKPEIQGAQSTRYFTGDDGAIYGITNDGITRNGVMIDAVPETVKLGAVNKPLHIGNALVDAGGKILYQAPAADETQRRLTHLESLRGRPNLDADQKAYFDAEITKLRSAPATATAPAHPVGSRAQKNGIWYVRGEDGIWKPEK